MKLFKPEVINQKRQDQNMELTRKNEKLIASLKKILALQKDIDFDADKAKKVKEYMQWCEDLQGKQSKELENLKAYQKLVEEKKEEYYKLLQAKDAIEDKITDLKEELKKLEIQVGFTKQILEKQNALLHK